MSHSDGEIPQIIAQYEKFGWRLQFAVVQPKFLDLVKENLPETIALRPHESLNALWFSRISAEGVAWEIRKVGGAPFALVMVLPQDIEKEEFDLRLAGLEDELAERFKTDRLDKQ